MTNRRIIVVLGMHRSGTSALTRGLQALGVDLGTNLMPPADENNNTGFWEDMDLYRFNEKLLAKGGSSWYRLSPFAANELWRGSHATERYEAAELLQNKFADNNIFGFKDPRTALILPFWQCVFEDLELEESYLLALRNPLEVAESLRKRNNFSHPYGLTLWAKHNWAAALHTEGKKRLCVSYSNLLRDPAGQLSRIAETFDLALPTPSSKPFVEFAGQFLSDDLRHNRISDKEIKRAANVPEVIPPFYDALLKWAEAAPSAKLDLPAALKAKLENFWTTTQPLLYLTDSFKTNSDAAAARYANAEKQRVQLSERLEEAAAAAERASAELGDAKAAIQKNKTEIEALQAKLRALSEQHSEQVERNRAQEAKEAQIRKELRTALETREHLAAELAVRDEKISELEALNQEMRTNAESDASAKEQLTRELAARDAQAAKDAASADQTRSDLKEATQKLASLKEREHQLADALSAANLDRENLKSSLQNESERASKLERELAEAADELKKATETVKSQNAKLSASVIRIESLSTEMAGLQTDLDTAQAAIAALNVDLKSARSQLEESAKRSKALEAGLQNADARIAELENDNVALSADRDASVSTIATLNADLAGRDDQIASLQSVLTSTREELSRQIVQLEFSNNAVRERDERITELTQLVALIEKRSSDQDRLLNETRGQVDLLQAELTDRTKDVRLLRYELNELVSEAGNFQAQANTQIANLQQANDHFDRAASAAQEQAARAKQDADSARATAAKHESLALEAQKQSEQFRTEAQHARNLADTLSKELSQIKSTNLELGKRIAGLEAAARNSADEWAQKIGKVESEKKYHKEMFDRNRIALDGALKTNQSLEKKILEQQEILNEQTTTLRLLRHEVHELRSSTSWKVTRPIRIAKALLTHPGRVINRITKR